MSNLWQIVAEIGHGFHPDRINSIAAKIASINSVEDFPVIKGSLGPNMNQRMINRLYHAWKNNTEEIGSAELAAALLGASAASSLQSQQESIELVWSGPSTGIVPVRHTEQVLCEVIERASKELFIVSFVAYEVDTIIHALQDAIDRQVSVKILLESSIEHGGKINYDSIKAIKEAVSSANIYIWSLDAKKSVDTQHSGAVHAKCAVADKDIAFITSANLSKAAMDKNMELGVLIKGGNLPIELYRHLEALISTKIIKQI